MSLVRQFTDAVASPRALAAMVLVMGALSAQGGRGTLAYFTSSSAGAENVFTSGKLVVANKINSSSTGTLSFSTSGNTDNTLGTSCAYYNPATGATLEGAQRMTPGTFCTGRLQVDNSGSNIDSYLRVRLIKTAGSETAGSADYQLNQKLTFSMSEYSAWSTDADCAPANYNPGNASSGAVTRGAASSASGAVTARTIGNFFGVTANWSSAAASTDNTGTSPTTNSYINLLGNDTLDGRADATGDGSTLSGSATTPLLTTSGTGSSRVGVDRVFCIMIHWPDGSTPTSNTADDNSAQNGENKYMIKLEAAQKSGRNR